MCIVTDYLSEFESELKAIQEITLKCKKRRDELNKNLSQCDLKLTDLTHALEFREELGLDAIEITKVSIEISKICKERRFIKNELERLSQLNAIINHIDSIDIKGARLSLKSNKDKQSNCKYTPRTDVPFSLGIIFK